MRGNGADFSVPLTAPGSPNHHVSCAFGAAVRANIGSRGKVEALREGGRSHGSDRCAAAA